MAKYKRQVNSVDRGNIGLERPGIYHLQVIDIDMEPNRNGKLVDGFEVKCGILAGTESAEVGKTHSLIFFNADLSSSTNSQEMANRKQDRFFYVIDLISEGNAGQEVEIETNDAIGRQFIAKFSEYENKGKTYIQLNYADMWHVDDPQVADVPKDEAALKLIPKQLRQTAKAKAATAKDNAYSESAKQPEKKAAEPAVSLDDI